MYSLQRLWQLLCNGWVGVWLLPLEQASLDEMVFEDRNQAYGAYALRKQYHWHLLVALGVTVSVSGTILLGFLWGQEQNASLPVPVVIRDDIRELPPPPPILPISPNVYNHVLELDDDLPNIPPPPIPTDWITELGGPATAWCSCTCGYYEEEFFLPEWALLEERPVPLNLDSLQKEIPIPPLMQEKGMVGWVGVRVLVNPAGAYVEHEIQESNHPHWREAVEVILPDLTFYPGLGQDGIPQFDWFELSFFIEL